MALEMASETLYFNRGVFLLSIRVLLKLCKHAVFLCFIHTELNTLISKTSKPGQVVEVITAKTSTDSKNNHLLQLWVQEPCVLPASSEPLVYHCPSTWANA